MSAPAMFMQIAARARRRIGGLRALLFTGSMLGLFSAALLGEITSAPKSQEPCPLNCAAPLRPNRRRR
jgi:hypothetical protein